MRCVGPMLLLLLAAALAFGCGADHARTADNDVSLRALKEHVGTYPGGQVMERFSYYADSSGEKVRHGLRKHYFDDGSLHIQSEYVDGEEHGEAFAFYSDGGLERHESWSHGKATGLWQGWHQTGELAWNATYRDGNIVGSKDFWMNGVVNARETYDNNGGLTKREVWYPYYPNAEATNTKIRHGKRSEGTYRNGLPHGTWTYWHKDGRVKAVGEWKDGKPWSGVCAVPAAGDAGSWGGLASFHNFKDGADLGPAALPEE